MKIVPSPQKLQRLLEGERGRRKTIGFVPTMGALHEGHLSLVRASRRLNDITVASIFVNPLQFGPREDYQQYPRPFAADKRLLLKEKIDYLFFPSVRDLYPPGNRIRVCVDPKLSRILCGKYRPGHFDGVATVVAKLLNIVGTCRLYLGSKDYQQAAVLKCLVKDMNFNVQVCVMPTVREGDGLAMSSRNRYLSLEERQRAAALFRVLFELKRQILERKGSLSFLKRQALGKLRAAVDQVQYLEVVDPQTLAPISQIQSKMIALTACFVGKTRLIDNVIITAS